MIIVLGYRGMLGRYIHHYLSKFYEVRGVSRDDFDATDLAAVRNFLEGNVNSGDIVVNCIGVTNKFPESDMYTVNAIFPHILAKICMRKDVQLFHPSTDCVFSGKRHILSVIDKYSATDHKDSEDTYGLSKSIGEEIPASVIRVSIIGEEGPGRHTNLLEWVRSNTRGEIRGYTNHFWNGITCLEYAKLLHSLIDTRDFWVGVRVYMSNTVSKYELVSLINEIYNLHIAISPFKTPEENDKTLLGHRVERTLREQIEELQQYHITP